MDGCVLYCSLFCRVDIFLTFYPFPQRASAFINGKLNIVPPVVPEEQEFVHII